MNQANPFLGAIELMIGKVRTHIVVLACFVLLSAILTFSQQKERNRKLDSEQKDTSAESASAADEKEKTRTKQRRKRAKATRSSAA